MKNLTIYSSIDSPHTHNIVKHLYKQWNISVIAYINKKTLSKQDCEFYHELNPLMELKSDMEESKTPAEYILSQKKIGLQDFFKSRSQFKILLSMRIKAESVTKSVEKMKTDIIYSHQLRSGIVSYLTNTKPYVMTFWGSDLNRDALNFNYKSLLVEALENAAKIQAVNNEQYDILQKEFGISKDKIFIQNFGADIANFKPAKNKQQLREKFGFKEKIILLSARYGKDRNLFRLDLILKAFNKLLEINPTLDCRLVFLNNAHLDEDLVKLVDELGLKNKVSFMGLLGGKDYADVIRLADIFIQCPLYDSVGVSLMESLSAGVPIITTHVTGAHINVKDNFNGLYLNERSVSEIVEKIQMLLTDESFYKKLSLNAHQWAIENCSREKAMSNINKELLKIK